MNSIIWHSTGEFEYSLENAFSDGMNSTEASRLHMQWRSRGQLHYYQIDKLLTATCDALHSVRETNRGDGSAFLSPFLTLNFSGLNVCAPSPNDWFESLQKIMCLEEYKEDSNTYNHHLYFGGIVFDQIPLCSSRSTLFLQYLGKFYSLRYLRLTQCATNREGVGALAKSLLQCTPSSQLEYLSLEGIDMDAWGLDVLLLALASCSSLSYLSFANNNIAECADTNRPESRGLKNLISYIDSGNCKLGTLNLSYNLLSRHKDILKHIRALCRAAAYCTTLRQPLLHTKGLLLDGNNFSSTEAEMLFAESGCTCTIDAWKVDMLGETDTILD